MNVAAKPVQLRDHYGAFALARCIERGGELGAALQGVRAFACLNLHVLADDLIAFRSGKARDVLSLSFKA
jgi:hypothetical protein